MRSAGRRLQSAAHCFFDLTHSIIIPKQRRRPCIILIITGRRSGQARPGSASLHPSFRPSRTSFPQTVGRSGSGERAVHKNQRQPIRNLGCSLHPLRPGRPEVSGSRSVIPKPICSPITLLLDLTSYKHALTRDNFSTNTPIPNMPAAPDGAKLERVDSYQVRHTIQSSICCKRTSHC